jgi:hypothetical protein
VGSHQETDSVSPFLITQSIENRSILVYHEFQIMIKSDSGYEEKVDEKFVHSKIDKICGDPQKHNLEFYSA